MTVIDKVFGWLGFARTTPEFAGETINPDGQPAWRVMDGLLYAQPPVIPAHIADSDNKELKEKYLKEALMPFRSQFATPYATGDAFRELGFTNVLRPLMEWDWVTRQYVIEQCHLAWERHPLAKTSIRMARLFSVQNGHQMTYTNDLVKDVLEAFRENPQNNVKELDKMAIETLHLDGELFLRFFEGGKPELDGNGQPTGEINGEPGEVVIAPLRTWYIRWIRANPSNFRDIYSYRYIGSITADSGLDTETYNEDIPADEILHVAVNRLPYEQRGRPELFAVLPYLQGYKRWLEDRARQNAFRGAVYDVSLKNATAGQVAARVAAYKKPMMAGAVNVHNDNETFQVLEQLVHASDASDDGRQIRLMVAAGMGLPEYMLGDGSNANLASATAQQLPAMRTFAEWKDIMIDQLWKPAFDRVLKCNVDAGVLPEYVPLQRSDGKPVVDDAGLPELISVYDAYDVSYTEDEEIDKMNAVQAILSAMNAGLMSEQTATGNLPFALEYDVEQEQIDREHQKSMDDMLAGRKPMPPNINPATGEFGQPQAAQDPAADNQQGDNTNDQGTTEETDNAKE